MKTCPKCAEQVQDAAKVCKHCNHRFFRPVEAAIYVTGLLFIGSIFLMPAIKDDGPVAQTTSSDSAIDATIVAERVVRMRLKDPDSAQFVHYGNGCGTVNSRNGFGGMTGPQEFIVTPQLHAVLQEDDPERFRKAWNKNCVEN